MKGVSKIDKYVIKKVRQRREELGISQYKLSLEMDLSKSFVGNIENENKISKWNLSHINELAKILKVSPQYFLPEKPL